MKLLLKAKWKRRRLQHRSTLEPPIGGWGQSSAVRAAAEAVSRSSRAMSMVKRAPSIGF